MPARKFETSEAVSFGWQSVWKSVWFWISLVLIVALLSWIRDALVDSIASEGGKAVVEVIYFFINAYITLGIARVALSYVDKKKTEYSDLKSDFKLYLNYVMATILYTLIVLVGFVLLVVPGVIWAIQFSMYPYLIIEKGYDPIQALKKSLEITRGERAHLFVYGLVLIGVIILGALALFVGLFIAIPIVWLSTAYVYRQLSSAAPAKVKASA